MKILITGAAGQDGSYIADRYHKSGHKVLGILSQNPNSKKHLFETSGIDLVDPVNAHLILDQFQPDLIFHLAAVHFASSEQYLLTTKSKLEMYNCNVEITRNILEWQSKNINSASLFALSSQMYSMERSGIYIKEDSILHPKNEYGESKKRAFDLIKKYRNELNIKCFGAILFNHTSSRNKNQFIFPQIANQLRQLIIEEKVEITLNDPGAEIDISHSDEVCEGMMQLIDLPVGTDLVFSSGKSVKISELIIQFLREMNLNKHVSLIKKLASNNSNKCLIGDATKAYNLIGWKTKRTPLEILLEIYQYGLEA
jgi:GDPmannose 4,6-dehydratase